MAQPQQHPVFGVMRFYNFLSEDASFLGEVLAGLARPRKTLPAKYFYDAHGRALFERIRELPGFFPARTELALMREHAAAMANFLGPDCQLIEIGCRSMQTTRILIEQLQPPLYVPLDLEHETLQEATAALAQTFPWLNVNAVCADCAKPLALPEFVGVPIRRKAVYIPGAAIGVFTPQEVLEFLQRARRMAGPGGALLIGVDQKKDEPDAAYKEATGAFAAFNLNLLTRINRELGGDFQLRRFRHLAVCDEDRGWIEMHIESLATQLVHVGGRRFDFAQGETILTGTCCKYGTDEFRALAQRAGFAPAQSWSDAAELFSVHGMTAV